MRYGVYVPNYGSFADPRALIELGIAAERRGWDAFFIWDHIVANWHGIDEQTVDAGVVLAAIATKTKTIDLGAMITPLPRREVSKVAHEVLSLNRLSEGRAIFGAGLGIFADYQAFGLPADQLQRGRKLSRQLRALRQLWRGKATDAVIKNVENPAVLQPQPKGRDIPIWIAGRWPPKTQDGRRVLGPFRRACHYDGIFPVTRSWAPPDGLLTPADYRELRELLSDLGRTAPIELVHGGVSDGPTRTAVDAAIAPYADAGVTYWLESFHEDRGGLTQAQHRIEQGPLGN